MEVYILFLNHAHAGRKPAVLVSWKVAWSYYSKGLVYNTQEKIIGLKVVTQSIDYYSMYCRFTSCLSISLV